MLVQSKLEDAAVAIISSSFASHSITNWSIFQGMSNNITSWPCVKVVCSHAQPLEPKELNLGISIAQLMILVCAVKEDPTETYTTTTKGEFDSVADLVINPFLSDTIMATVGNNTTNLVVKSFCESDAGLDVETSNDLWVATQNFEVVCGRTA